MNKSILSSGFFIGLFLYLISFFFLNIDVNMEEILNDSHETHGKTTAKIIDIKKHYDENFSGEKYKEIYIEYYIKDKSYKHTINYYSSDFDNYYFSGFKKGKSVDIFYNIENPDDYRLPENNFLKLFLLMMCLIFMIKGSSLMVVPIINIIRIKKLIKKNNYIETVILGVKKNPSIGVFIPQTYFITCSNIDDLGTVYKSENINNCQNVHIGNIIKVYIDKENINNYFVDIRNLQ